MNSNQKLTMSEWIKFIESKGWTPHVRTETQRWYVHPNYIPTLVVGYGAEEQISCEVSACLPTTFIEVTSKRFDVTDLSRYSYVLLLVARIDHACNMYTKEAIL